MGSLPSPTFAIVASRACPRGGKALRTFVHHYWLKDSTYKKKVASKGCVFKKKNFRLPTKYMKANYLSAFLINISNLKPIIFF